MGGFLGAEEVNDACGTMTHMGTMDRGFTVLAK
jgi:hypothetical protein